MLFIAGGFYAATAAAAPVIQVGSVTGSAGGPATFSVTLSAGGASVAAIENDISFDASTPVAVATTGYCAITTTTQCSSDAVCPDLPTPFTGKEPCILSGGPSCSVNPAIGKGGFFSFLPNGCTPATAGSCTGIRALIVAVDNLTAIPDGSTLYSCNVAIASDATVEDHALTISNVSAGDINQALIAGVTGTPGQITVTPLGQQYWVCDVAPASGDNVGSFGNNSLNIADVKAIFKASLDPTHFAPAAGTARFSAMDAAPADNPPTCGGNTSLNIADVKLCFKRSLSSSEANYLRTGTGTSCSSELK